MLEKCQHEWIWIYYFSHTGCNIATMNIRTTLKCKCIFFDFLTNALIFLKGLSPDTAIMVRSKTPWYKDKPGDVVHIPGINRAMDLIFPNTSFTRSSVTMTGKSLSILLLRKFLKNDLFLHNAKFQKMIRCSLPHLSCYRNLARHMLSIRSG
jgi:hypothetical protein